MFPKIMVQTIMSTIVAQAVHMIAHTHDQGNERGGRGTIDFSN
jgi:hypothetical protein